MALYGLDALMEAIHQSEHVENVTEAHVALFESATDEEVKRLIIGDDSVENDLEGKGLTKKEEDALNKFIEKIPTTEEDGVGGVDDITEDEVEETMSLLESLHEEITE